MSRSQIVYDICQLAGHDELFLNFVCVDQACPQRGQLLCLECCAQSHKKCLCLELSKFIKQFNDQLIIVKADDVDWNNTQQLLSFYNNLKTILLQTQKVINIIFEQVQQIIQSGIDQLGNLNMQQQQKEKLIKIQNNCSKEAFASIIQEIESFGPNSQQFNFTIKKPNQVLLLNNLEERIQNAEQYVEQFQESMKNLTMNLKDWQNDSMTPLQNFFLIQCQTQLKEELYYVQHLNPEFRILTGERRIHKILYLNSDTIAGIGGNQLQVFKLSNRQILFQQQTSSEITDMVYNNKILYIATKKGEILLFKGDQFQLDKEIVADKPGILQILINNNTMITLGQEFIKIWSLQQMAITQQRQIDNVSVFHLNDNLIYFGSNETLQIWDIRTDKIKSFYLKGKLIGILTNQKKLILAFPDLIQVFEDGDFQSMKFENIKQIQVLQQFPIVLIACSQSGVYMYNYEMKTVEKFFDQSVDCFTVIGFDNVYYLAFGKEIGECVTGRLEQDAKI